MLLSNTAIYEALDDGRLVIDPQPTPRYPTITQPKTPYDSTAINLTLGNILRIPEEDMSIQLDVPGGNITKTLSKFYKQKVLEENESYKLETGVFIIANTREYIKLPRERKAEWGNKRLLAARVEGKSSFARVGLLVHFTAPTIHCGFEGTITLELVCLGKYPVSLQPDMSICQLLIEEVVGDPSDYVSQFQSQTKPEGV
jgi:dCTP deaminase